MLLTASSNISFSGLCLILLPSPAYAAEALGDYFSAKTSVLNESQRNYNENGEYFRFWKLPSREFRAPNVVSERSKTLVLARSFRLQSTTFR